MTWEDILSVQEGHLISRRDRELGVSCSFYDCHGFRIMTWEDILSVQEGNSSGSERNGDWEGDDRCAQDGMTNGVSVLARLPNNNGKPNPLAAPGDNLDRIALRVRSE